MEVYLEVGDENLVELTELAFDVKVGDEIPCEAVYDRNPADPSVGINSASCNVHTVECNGVDISRFFDLEALCERAGEYEDNALEDAKYEAAVARWEQMDDYDG